jgi:hypothetical protein
MAFPEQFKPIHHVSLFAVKLLEPELELEG